MYVNEGRYNETKSELENALQFDPVNADVLIHLAKM